MPRPVVEVAAVRAAARLGRFRGARSTLDRGRLDRGAGALGRPRPTSAAIVATDPRAATASRADGSARVELPWLLPGDTGAAVSPDGRQGRVLERASRQHRDLRRGRPHGERAAPHGQRPRRRRRSGLVAGRPAARLGERPARQHDLFVMDADGAEKRRLVEDRADDVEPAWSPDGTRIAFASNRDGRYRLWAVDAVGGEPAVLVVAPGQSRSPSWSPAGDGVAYTGVGRRQRDVWVAPLDGSPAAAGDDRAGIRRPPRLVARRPSARVRQQSRRRPAHLADARRRQPPAGHSRRRSRETTRPTGRLVEESISPEPGHAAPRPRPAGTERHPRDAVGRTDEARVHVGGRQHRRRADPHPRHAARSRADDAGRSARPPAGRHVRVVRESAGSPTSRTHLTSTGISSRTRRTSCAAQLDDAFVAATARAGSACSTAGAMRSRRPGIVPGPPRFVGDCAAPPARGPAGRRGIVGRLHRSLSRLLPRAGHRHHGPRRRALRARPPRQPRPAHPRSSGTRTTPRRS